MKVMKLTVKFESESKFIGKLVRDSLYFHDLLSYMAAAQGSALDKISNEGFISPHENCLVVKELENLHDSQIQ